MLYKAQIKRTKESRSSRFYLPCATTIYIDAAMMQVVTRVSPYIGEELGWTGLDII